MSCPSSPTPLKPYMPIPCPGIIHARDGGGGGGYGGGGGDNVGGGGSGGGNCDGCDGGVMTAKRNKSDQEFHLAFTLWGCYVFII